MGHYSAASATQTPRQIQDHHMRVKGWSDIGYNFLINSVTGLLYEGRGWTTLGAHCAGHNTENIGVCIIGKDQAGRQDVSDAARSAFKWLYEEDVSGISVTMGVLAVLATLVTALLALLGTRRTTDVQREANFDKRVDERLQYLEQRVQFLEQELTRYQDMYARLRLGVFAASLDPDQLDWRSDGDQPQR
ncbi:N-acetylmuramoyl-L-alanine amidase [Micromonospora sp. NPDC047527]|uniref:N-acetylmuramoyl-L-alanine amidase n=1 Tax=Micromonospora sp. NPDC047527 TaxID=3155144 RepID=UPI0033D36711